MSTVDACASHLSIDGLRSAQELAGGHLPATNKQMVRERCKLAIRLRGSLHSPQPAATASTARAANLLTLAGTTKPLQNGHSTTLHSLHGLSGA